MHAGELAVDSYFLPRPPTDPTLPMDGEPVYCPIISIDLPPLTLIQLPFTVACNWTVHSVNELGKPLLSRTLFPSSTSPFSVGLLSVFPPFFFLPHVDVPSKLY